MIIITNKELCCGCGACYNSCPNKAIQMVEDQEGFLYPEINKTKCINCSICEKVCPIKNIKIEEDTELIKLAAWSKNKEIRKSSSSGGIFYTIANYIIENSGVVCAAGFDENMNVVHKIISEKKQIKELQGSKYVQSDIGQCNREVKKLLEEGKKVLFVGTPCQVSGLLTMLGKKYNNLYLCDFICHGVPSPKVYKKYKKELEDTFKSKLNQMNFRDKRNGWIDYSVVAEFENGKKYIKNAKRDIYIKGFLKNVYLRPSCYKCKFLGLNRGSDITIDDFWGIEEKIPKVEYNNGVSLILIHSIQGKELIENCKFDIEIKEQEDLNFIVKHNPSIVAASKENSSREDFFRDLEKYKMKKLYRKYFYENKYMRKLKYIIKRGKDI